MKSGSSVAVIGGGLGGLAAACVAAARGHRVTLYDKNAWLGGKAAVLHEGGFRFDMGPTILTVPRVLERIFAEAGRSVHDALDLRRLDPQWRCFFEDGSRIDLVENVEAMAASMDRFAPGQGVGDGYKKFLSISENLHSVSERFFFWKAVQDLFDTIDIRANMNPATLRDVLSLRMHSTVAGTIRGKVKDARLAQMLDHFVQYVGSSPYGAPAVLCAIGHMQVSEGVWYPMGGTRAVAKGLAKLATDLGAEMRPAEEVTGLDIAGGAVRGVRTARGTVAYDAVISNMDSVRTYRELVGGETGKAYDAKTFEPACSGVVLYLGLNKRYGHLGHHDFVFSRDPEEEFDFIYRKGEPAPDPTAYLAAPSITDPSVAPEGGEALYVLVHTPYLRPHHDWQKMFPAYRRVILDKLKRTGGMPDIEERIVVERHLTPQDIHERYNVLNGAIYGLASHGRVTGAFKPGNRSREVKGLYLAGGAAHPGPGMPMVMMSGWIAADTLDTDLRAGARPDLRASA
ncbi:phytoene desaturase family protein [Methylobacterium gnaphalii]|uniref:Phytoene desaturase n=1 Tax=Methylobacterium gnaphalii TaxID=1010610 RepID=A0A512JHN2_9HYPH|nr:phytoene desaturase family protein [Methylobacterium gnaphalii]GEP09468.1 phytoene desaturase [Methylobacterium gnaphalii]GJD68054.1 4,4'-diapolycopene oxygenase [Methylobacterium gnaphalii]GLS51583.1 phytoene desaturase [Methylobacterium gnaphalii]